MRYLFAILILLAASCTDEESTISTLQKSGYTNIKIGDYAWFDCSENDFFRTRFSATNVNGERVEGVVCCGLLFKSCTVRF